MSTETSPSSTKRPIETLDDALAVIEDLRNNEKALRKRAQDAESERDDLGLQVSGLQTQIDEHTKTLGERDTELTNERFGRLRDRLAHDRGIPSDIAESINAADEETLTARLDALAAFRGNTSTPVPEEPAPREQDPAQAAPQIPNEQEEQLALANQFFQTS
ncbi:hypothetical protein ACFJGV_15130 [Cnuibacter sp. UC19_7]|uniref:hypothetical protein n=1 Tax=Cnuibacter sp. UC19_7 TaxID=3350166 RepID=UPI003672812C